MIFRQLSRRYGWIPHQVGQLTLGQLLAYLGTGSETVLIDRHAIREHLGRRQQERNRWIDSVLRRGRPN